MSNTDTTTFHFRADQISVRAFLEQDMVWFDGADLGRIAGAKPSNIAIAIKDMAKKLGKGAEIQHRHTK